MVSSNGNVRDNLAGGNDRIARSCSLDDRTVYTLRNRDRAAAARRAELRGDRRQKAPLMTRAALAGTLCLLTACDGYGAPATGAPRPLPQIAESTTRSYRTHFPLTENPISEGGRWLNGGVTGLDWTNVQTAPGVAFGTMPGNAYYPQEYADSTAILRGKWGRNQTVRATLAVHHQSNSRGVYEEVELRVRTTIRPHSITGYEINCSVNRDDPYVQVVRWNGPLANFTELDGRAVGCKNGDVLKAVVTGDNDATIAVYKGGTQVFTVTDYSGAFTSGNPGIGFFLEGATGLNAAYGFSDFRASAPRR